MCGEDDIHFVGFFAGIGSPTAFGVSSPYSHWSDVTVEILGCCINLSTHGSCQLVAVAGCSCKECRPACTWSLYSPTTKWRCFTASRLSASTFSGAIFLKFIPWFHALKKVHGGLPISHVGFSSSMIFLAILRSDPFEKSHGSPDGLQVRKSNALRPLIFRFLRHPCDARTRLPCPYISKKVGE